jgi:hypothetical protein
MHNSQADAKRSLVGYSCLFNKPIEFNKQFMTNDTVQTALLIEEKLLQMRNRMHSSGNTREQRQWRRRQRCSSSFLLDERYTSNDAIPLSLYKIIRDKRKEMLANKLVEYKRRSIMMMMMQASRQQQLHQHHQHHNDHQQWKQHIDLNHQHKHHHNSNQHPHKHRHHHYHRRHHMQSNKRLRTDEAKSVRPKEKSEWHEEEEEAASKIRASNEPRDEDRKKLRLRLKLRLLENASTLSSGPGPGGHNIDCGHRARGSRRVEKRIDTARSILTRRSLDNYYANENNLLSNHYNTNESRSNNNKNKNQGYCTVTNIEQEAGHTAAYSIKTREMNSSKIKNNSSSRNSSKKKLINKLKMKQNKLTSESRLRLECSKSEMREERVLTSKIYNEKKLTVDGKSRSVGRKRAVESSVGSTKFFIVDKFLSTIGAQNCKRVDENSLVKYKYLLRKSSASRLSRSSSKSPYKLKSNKQHLIATINSNRHQILNKENTSKINNNNWTKQLSEMLEQESKSVSWSKAASVPLGKYHSSHSATSTPISSSPVQQPISFTHKMPRLATDNHHRCADASCSTCICQSSSSYCLDCMSSSSYFSMLSAFTNSSLSSRSPSPSASSSSSHLSVESVTAAVPKKARVETREPSMSIKSTKYKFWLNSTNMLSSTPMISADLNEFEQSSTNAISSQLQADKAEAYQAPPVTISCSRIDGSSRKSLSYPGKASTPFDLLKYCIFSTSSNSLKEKRKQDTEGYVKLNGENIESEESRKLLAEKRVNTIKSTVSSREKEPLFISINKRRKVINRCVDDSEKKDNRLTKQSTELQPSWLKRERITLKQRMKLPRTSSKNSVHQTIDHVDSACLYNRRSHVKQFSNDKFTNQLLATNSSILMAPAFGSNENFNNFGDFLVWYV